MKTFLLCICLALLLCLGGCATGAGPSRSEPASYSPWENPLGVTDPALDSWYNMPYYNPYLQ